MVFFDDLHFKLLHKKELFRLFGGRWLSLLFPLWLLPLKLLLNFHPPTHFIQEEQLHLRTHVVQQEKDFSNSICIYSTKSFFTPGRSPYHLKHILFQPLLSSSTTTSSFSFLVLQTSNMAHLRQLPCTCSIEKKDFVISIDNRSRELRFLITEMGPYKSYSISVTPESFDWLSSTFSTLMDTPKTTRFFLEKDLRITACGSKKHTTVKVTWQKSSEWMIGVGNLASLSLKDLKNKDGPSLQTC